MITTDAVKSDYQWKQTSFSRFANATFSHVQKDITKIGNQATHSENRGSEYVADFLENGRTSYHTETTKATASEWNNTTFGASISDYRLGGATTSQVHSTFQGNHTWTTVNRESDTGESVHDNVGKTMTTATFAAASANGFASQTTTENYVVVPLLTMNSIIKKVTTETITESVTGTYLSEVNLLDISGYGSQYSGGIQLSRTTGMTSVSSFTMQPPVTQAAPANSETKHWGGSVQLSEIKTFAYGSMEDPDEYSAIVKTLSTRFWGTLKLAFGVAEVAVGTAAVYTGVGAPFGVIAIVHGLDTMYAGAAQVVSGTESDTLTKRLANSVFLASFKPANEQEKQQLEMFGEGIDSLVGIVGGLGGMGGAKAAFNGAKQLKQGGAVAKTAAGQKAIDAASDVGSNLRKAALGSKADDVANVGSDVAETIGQTGCFAANTPCLISVSSVNADTNELVSSGSDSGTAAIAIREKLRNIQDVKLGDRVLTQNPRREDVEYDPHNESLSDWQKISMEVRHRNGAVVDVELLRSRDWVVRNQFQVGTWISFELTDIEVDGRAFINGICDVQDLEDGDGELVTGRFVTRNAMDLRRITLDDGTQITATGSHPFWNPNSFQWQPLEDFGIGDALASRQGLREITHIELLPEGATVYNIEVAGEHVYEVGECGVLVHNSSGFNCQRYYELLLKRHGGTLTDAAERAEYVDLLRQLKNENYGAYLTGLVGSARANMVRPHAHHILFKLGLGAKQREMVLEGMEILLRNGIDPIMGKANLVWAPNIAGQHTTAALKRVLDALKEADAGGAEAVRQMLERLGRIAANLT